MSGFFGLFRKKLLTPKTNRPKHSINGGGQTQAKQKHSPRNNEMSVSAYLYAGYIECLEWADCQAEQLVSDGVEVDSPEWEAAENASFSDSLLRQARKDCLDFYLSPEYEAFIEWRKENDGAASDGQAGHDFWLTRNGHGTGFWDREESYYGPHRDALDALARKFGETWVTLGDDGLIYLD